MVWVEALEHPGHGVRAIVEARACSAWRLQQGDGSLQLTATVFEGGGWATHHRDEAPAQVGHRVARPGGGSRYPETADTVYREGTGSELMVMGVTGQHGQNLAGPHAHAEIDHPHEAMTKEGLAQGHASEHAGGVDADECES